MLILFRIVVFVYTWYIPGIRVFVMKFIEQHKWFGLSSTVHSCLFLVSATDVYFYLMLYV